MACKYETSNGRCGLKGCYAYRHKCYTEDMCKCHEPMTNADRIRAMRDEELARFFIGDSPNYCHTGLCLDGETCIGCFLKWLQQPAEGE